MSAVIPARGVLCSFPGPRSCRPADVHRAITRMAHEIAERNRGLDKVVLVGLQTGGVAIAEQLAATLAEVGGSRPSRWAPWTWPSTGTTSGCARCCPRRPPTSAST